MYTKLKINTGLNRLFKIHAADYFKQYPLALALSYYPYIVSVGYRIASKTGSTIDIDSGLNT